jgi:hypothetical protein
MRGVPPTRNHGKLTRVLIILWAVWHARQKTIHEQQFQSPLTTHMLVERFMEDLRQSEETKPKKETSNQTRSALGWIPPLSGIGKNLGRGTMATVARPDHGVVFMGASAIVLLRNANPETLEALACRKGLALARDITARSIRVASDCKTVVDSIAEGTRGVYAQVVLEIVNAKEDYVSLYEEFPTKKHYTHSLGVRC